MEDSNILSTGKPVTSDEMIDNIFTLSRKEMQEVASERISEINKEFSMGFKFLEDYPKSVTFFGSNQFPEDNKHYISARTLSAKIVTELGYSVLSGGGPGIMEAANRGAQEAGGNSLGLIIKLPREQKINKYITKAIQFYYFFVRKVCLSFSAEAFIFFPGGYGTLDEFFEILTLVQTRKIPNIPIVCVGSEYWNKLDAFIKDELLSRSAIDKADLNLYMITDDHDEVIDIIKNAPVRVGLPFNGGIYKKEG